ncbi:MAG: DUF4912 domain-containing protein [Elusimicrobia bacterium]|nr:DUF4912 domain-containing protein [Elusimicrobiota bacterium]
MTSSSHINKEKEQPVSGHGQSLPENYGETEAALLPRDPNWMFTYWEITDNSRARLRKEHGQDVFEKSKPVIRVYDMAGVTDPKQSPHYFDVPITLDARNWYINVQEPGGSHCCEIGLILPDGRFAAIVRTNVVTLPTGGVSEITDEKWLSVSGDFDKLLQLSGVEYIGKGSGEVAKSLAQRWEMLRTVFSRASSWGVSSMSSQARQQQKPAEKKFWLVADCELILYGATEPDARVTVLNRKINLNPDGTFSMRFALPDGGMELPIKAQSKDETDSREIDIKVTRATITDGK